MNCIMVKEQSGYYDFDSSAEIEYWPDVKSQAETVERIEDLQGWGEWTAAYHVTWERGTVTYFVAERGGQSRD